MSRALLVIANDGVRRRAAHWLAKAPWNTRVTFQGPVRTLDQNSKMWACLTDIATQLEWHGQRYSTDDWKDFLVHQLRRARWMPDEEGGFVPIGMRTSDLSKEEMGDLLTIIIAFGDRHGVAWTEPAREAA